MRMRALHTIDNGKEQIKAGEEFTPASKKEGEMLASCNPPAAAWITQPEEKPAEDPNAGKGAGASGGTGSPADKGKTPEPQKKLPAAEAIEAIGKCKTIEEVKPFFKNEDRPTVINAARAQIKVLKDAEKK